MGAEGHFFIVMSVLLAAGPALLAPPAEAAQSPPYFTSTPPQEASVGKLYEYDANATDPENDQLYYYPSQIEPDSLTIDPASGYVSWTPAKEGNETIIIWVTDGNFQVEQRFTVLVGPGNQPPQITSTPPTRAYVGLPYTYQVSARDPEGDRIYYFLDNSPPGMTIAEASGVINWTPPEALADQTVSVVVRAKDIGNTGTTQYYAIKVSRAPSNENHLPVVTGSDIITATQDELYFYAITANDTDGDDLSFSVTLGPAGMAIERSDARSAVLTWTPTAAELGVHEVRVTVSDGKATVMHNFSLVVFPSHPQHVNEDPAMPVTYPDIVCLVPPALSIAIVSTAILLGMRRTSR